MKFGKNLLRVVDLSDPEWGPFWMNYKLLKSKIDDIVSSRGGENTSRSLSPNEISKSTQEIEFFVLLRQELKKTSDFFATSEQLYRLRYQQVSEGYKVLKALANFADKPAWSRLLAACLKLYKDVLLLENFAIMNYCGFSKILKKHDKLTGYTTRDAFMRNVMNHQNFTHYSFVMELTQNCEVLFDDIKTMESSTSLQDEEKLFIEAIRDLNNQANQLHTLESEHISFVSESKDQPAHISKTSKLFEHSIRSEPGSEKLEEVTNAAFLAASKLPNLSFSPDLREAISWVDAVSSRSDGTKESGNKRQIISSDEKIIKLKRI